MCAIKTLLSKVISRYRTSLRDAIHLRRYQSDSKIVTKQKKIHFAALQGTKTCYTKKISVIANH